MGGTVLKISVSSLLLAGGLVFGSFHGAPAAPAPFKLTSPAIADNAPLAKKFAGDNKDNPNCVGQSISPPLKWANPPDGTTSFALVMLDPEGRLGLGVVHMVTYGIPASVTGFAEG